MPARLASITVIATFALALWFAYAPVPVAVMKYSVLPTGAFLVVAAVAEIAPVAGLNASHAGAAG